MLAVVWPGEGQTAQDILCMNVLKLSIQTCDRNCSGAQLCNDSTTIPSHKTDDDDDD